MRAVAILLWFSLASFSQAASLADYLKLRKQFGITQAAGVQALETMVGKRTLEVRGRVNGVVGSDQGDLVLLNTPEGRTIFVSTSDAPEWLIGGEVSARLLIKAEKPDANAELRAQLIAVARDDQVAAIDAKQRQAEAKAAKSQPMRVPAKNSRTAKNWNLPVSQALPHYASFIKRRNPKLEDEEVWRIARGVVGFSIRYGVDARLIMAMVLVESGFDPGATSRAGAQGLGQLMPGTARGMGVSNAYDSLENLYGTVRLVRGHMDKYQQQTGDDYQALVLSLAAYNAGGGAVRRHGGVPPYRETQNYIRKVIRVYEQMSG